MDGENHGKPYEQMDYLGYHDFWKHPYLIGKISRLNFALFHGPLHGLSKICKSQTRFMRRFHVCYFPPRRGKYV